MIALIVGTKVLLGSYFLPLISFYCLTYLYILCKTSHKSFWTIIRENLSLIGAPSSITQERIKVTPWVTWTLIVINSFVFLFLQTDDTALYIRNNLMCLPATPNLINYPLSFLTSMYLHADFSHLFGNMCFLWATGTIVERRIGWQRFLVAYHITGLAGAALAVIVYAGIQSKDLHMLGASGAISGVMGVYLVRCYFKKMILPIPLLGFLPVSFNLQLNAFVVIGLFFVLDIKGGLAQLNGVTLQTGHWDHLGGMVTGIFMAYRMKLTNVAIEERHRELGSNLIDGKRIVSSAFDAAGGFAGAEKSLLRALSIDPDNTDTLVELARLKSYNKAGEEGREYYVRSLRLLLKRSAHETTTVFKEFFSKYRETIEPDSQFQIAGLLYREDNLDLACRTLEMLVDHSDTPEPLREKACFMVARLLEKMSLNEAAENYYIRFVQQFPASPQVLDAMARLEILRST